MRHFFFYISGALSKPFYFFPLSEVFPEAVDPLPQLHHVARSISIKCHSLALFIDEFLNR